jgi:hypothetical protein
MADDLVYERLVCVTIYSISPRKQDFWLLEIGAPLEVVGRLSALTSEVEMN